jgi:hypothetical protein
VTPSYLVDACLLFTIGVLLDVQRGAQERWKLFRKAKNMLGIKRLCVDRQKHTQIIDDCRLSVTIGFTQTKLYIIITAFFVRSGVHTGDPLALRNGGSG